MELKTIQASNGVSVTGPTISGSGSGEFNVISSPNDASSGWAASGAGITVSTSTTTTDLPLGPNVSTSIKITPVSGTDYVYYRWTMPDALKNRKLKVQWEQRPLSGYASGDLEVEVYKNSASNYGGSYTRFDLSTDSSGVSSIPNASGRFNTNFDSDDADYYELRVTRVSGTTALNITSVIVGPGTVNLAQNDVDYGSVGGTWDADSTTTVYGPSGSLMGGALTASRLKTITWPTPTQKTHTIAVQMSYDGNYWFDAAMYSPYSLSSSGTDDTSAGVRISTNTATTTVVRFSRYRYIANDDSPTSEWANTVYWRVVRFMGGNAVGFGQATTSALGLVKAGQVPGQVTGSSTAAGYIGEIITGTSSSPAIGTAGTATEVFSISLTAGLWQLFGKIAYSIGGSAVFGTDNYIACDISSVSGTIQNVAYSDCTVSGGTTKTRHVQNTRTVALSSSATYYLNGRHNLSTTTGCSYDTSGIDSTTFYAVRIG